MRNSSPIGLLQHAKASCSRLQRQPSAKGTLTHFDAPLQRLRQATPRPADVRPGWQVFSDISKALGTEIDVFAGPIVSGQVFHVILLPRRRRPLDEIGGKGVARWPEREAAAKWPVRAKLGAPKGHQAMPAANGKLRLGTYSSVWDAPEQEGLTCAVLPDAFTEGRTVARGRQAPEPGQRPALSSRRH